MGLPPDLAMPSDDFMSRRGGGFQAFGAMPDVKWKGDYCCFFGTFTPVCATAWAIFLVIPLLFYIFALPTLEELGPWVKLTGFCLFGGSALCYLLAGCVNPGVPKRPPEIPDPKDSTDKSEKLESGEREREKPLEHPGSEYTLSRDSNRYVNGFDHYCEFVGNDIGKGNMPCFVSFLALLALLSTFVAVACIVGVYLMATEPAPAWHLNHSVWRYIVAGLILAWLLYGLFQCGTSDICSGVGGLVMMMPGASVGGVLLIIVLTGTVIAPFVTDMFDDITPQSNPTTFFLVLPTLGFAVLFWGMGLHWVFLICEGISQKLWLKAKGIKFGKKRPQPETDTTGAAPKEADGDGMKTGFLLGGRGKSPKNKGANGAGTTMV